MKLGIGGIIGLILLLGVATLVGVRLMQGDMGHDRYEVVGIGGAAKKVSVTRKEFDTRLAAIALDKTLTQDERAAAVAQLKERVPFSWPRTVGLWLAALLTLSILSFLYRDNPLYRIAEHAYVGISAGYVMVLMFWQVVVPQHLEKLFPKMVKSAFRPELDLNQIAEDLALKSWLSGVVPYEDGVGLGWSAEWYQMMDFWYWIPTVLSVMLVWRLMPAGQWISRWPLAFLIGATAGMRLVAYLLADFVAQIRAAIRPLFEPQYYANEAGEALLHWGRTFYVSMNNTLLLFSTLCVLIYFFFSLEHRGAVGRMSRLGIWVLMIAFGAGFGYTVMGRIALLVGRFQFLVQDWLNYDPAG